MQETITNAVKEQYGRTATSGLSSSHAGVRAVAEAFGYSPEELAAIPAEANMGLSCGNPTATASLRAGETVVDLGCGGGMDLFLAARKVGPTGRAIGIDMTPQMVELARRNADKAGATNVQIHQATIDKLPLPDASVDVVISNCVINLADDKPAVFREIARVLKPGGRVAVSDIALKQPLPAELAQNIAAFVGCIAGAIPIEAYRQGLIDAGLSDVVVIDDQKDLNAYASVDGQAACCTPPTPATPTGAPGNKRSLTLATTGCCGGTTPATPDTSAVHEGLRQLLRQHDLNTYAASVKVYGVKR